MQALTVSNNFPKIFSYGDAYLGLTGLATDVTTMYIPSWYHNESKTRS